MQERERERDKAEVEMLRILIRMKEREMVAKYADGNSDDPDSTLCPYSWRWQIV